MTTYEVKDGARTLRFDGTKLAESSSWRRGSSRWIEFQLYRTESGSYILARTGVSTVFHSSFCTLVGRYGLHEATVDELGPDAFPCLECRPTLGEPIVYPEKYRYWTLVSEEPEAVLDALYKNDGSGARYLTNVAHRLLEEASKRDPAIDAAYRFEVIP